MREYGTPAKSLTGMGGRYDAQSLRLGAAGERTTARLRAQGFARDDNVVVMHDLDIPSSSGRMSRGGGNVDHVVVRGDRVMIIDSKAWAGGFYWTVGGHTRRGFKKAPWVDKRTVGLAVDRFALILPNAQVSGLLIVHSAGGKPPVLPLVRLADGVKAVAAERAVRRIDNSLGGNVPADPEILAVLAKFLRSGK
jgi:hypothetical protein